MTASLSVNERPVPARARPFHKAARRQPAWMKLVVGRDMSPTEPEWQAMVDALWEGDEPMDRLVDWMFAGNPREARVLMERRVDHTISDILETIGRVETKTRGRTFEQFEGDWSCASSSNGLSRSSPKRADDFQTI